MSALDARDDLREMADTYVTVASLDLSPDPSGVRGVPGSRVPPGAQAILDADEVGRVLREVDEWARFLQRVLLNEAGIMGGLPTATTQGALRHVAEHAAHFLDHDDEGLRLAFTDDLRQHKQALNRLSRRALRFVRTGMGCQDPTCNGQYVADLPRIGKPTDGAITCDRCRHRVENSVWTSWPRARVEWVTVEHAARMLDTTINTVRIRAHRLKWKRQGTGRNVKYYVPDVRGERDTIPA